MLNFKTGCPLNQAEMIDIWNHFHRSPYIRLGAEIFTAMVLKTVPQIKLKGFDDQNADFVLIQELHHRPFLIQFYIHYHLFGIVPIYKKKITGTKYYKPLIPPFGSGQIWTEFDLVKKEQIYKFHWQGSNDYDRKIYFRVGNTPPGLDGKINSSLASLLNDWRTCAIIRQSTELVAYQQARQQHVFEFHPSKINPGDDALVGLESFGEKIAGSVMLDQEKLSNYRMEVRSEALMNSLKAADYLNYGMRNQSRYDNSEAQSSQLERETSLFMSRGYSLKPDVVYKPVPTPHLGISLNDFVVRLDKVGSALMDIPLQLIESTGVKSQANMQGNLRFINERMQEWIRLFCDVTKQFFLIAYGKQIMGEEAFKNRDIDKEVEVILPCTPIANVDDIMRVHKEGMMLKEDAGSHVFNILGLPSEQLHCTSWPDGVAKELLIGKKKEGGEKSKKLF